MLKELLDTGLDNVNVQVVKGLTEVSKRVVGVSTNKRAADTRVYTDVKAVVTSLREVRKCEVKLASSQVLRNALEIQRDKQEVKKATAAYHRAVRMQKQKVHEQRKKRLESMDAAGKCKMLHSMISKAKEGAGEKGVAASEATTVEWQG